MDSRRTTDVPLLEQVKIQAQVLVPVLRAFRAELGDEPANRIAWRALAEWRQQVAADMAAGLDGRPAERWAATQAANLPRIGDAVDVDMQAQTPGAVVFNVTGCRFAEFFRALGEPDLGFALLCAMDDAMVEVIGQDEVQLTRTGTIMHGAPRCDFHYALAARTAD